MKTISVYWFGKILHTLIPIIFCIGFSALPVVLVIVVINSETVAIRFVALCMVTVACCLGLPFLYKQFFDKSFVGFDRPIKVNWTDGTIYFYGVYFELEVPIENVISYELVPAGVSELRTTLNIDIKRASDNISRMWVSPAMKNKFDLVEFLKTFDHIEHKKRRWF